MRLFEVWCLTLLGLLFVGVGCDARRANYSQDLPHTIFQVGAMRTATTLQFVTVCAAVAIKTVLHDPEATLDCYFLERGYKLLSATGNHYQVVKSHGGFVERQLKNLTMFSPDPVDNVDRAWVFHTQHNSKMPNKVQAFDKFGIPDAVTVDTFDVGQDGVYARRKEYEEAFSLTPEESELLFEWLVPWDTLRVCCGRQMSKSWRNYLTGDQKFDNETKHSRFGNSSLAAPSPIQTCLSMDLDELERQVTQTTLFRELGGRVPVFTRASNKDLVFDGHYCTLCNTNIQRFKLKFNNACDERSIATFCHNNANAGEDAVEACKDYQHR